MYVTLEQLKENKYISQKKKKQNIKKNNKTQECQKCQKCTIRKKKLKEKTAAWSVHYMYRYNNNNKIKI